MSRVYLIARQSSWCCLAEALVEAAFPAARQAQVSLITCVVCPLVALESSEQPGTLADARSSSGWPYRSRMIPWL